MTDPNEDNHFEVGNAAVADFACEPDRIDGYEQSATKAIMGSGVVLAGCPLRGPALA